MSVICTHTNAGFFSCCSMRLDNIVEYINNMKQIPIHVDSSIQFSWYKKDNDNDITFDYFDHYDNITNVTINHPINYKEYFQYTNFSELDYAAIIPLIKKYFSPSKGINDIINNIELKYNLVYENICVLFYRGNDKIIEAPLSKYDDYVIHANRIMENNPNILFLIQSDETEFIEYMSSKFPNSFYFKDEIRHMQKCESTVDKKFKDKNYEFSKYYLAITIIMSKCKYIVCGLGNCSIWIMFYRGNTRNTCQYLTNRRWITNL